MNRRKTPKIFFSSYRPKKPRQKNNGQIKQLMMVALIVVGGYFFTRLPIFQIKTVDTTGIISQEVVAELNELIGQSILSSGVANKVLKIKSNYIELIDLRCDKGIPDTLKCKVVQRVPIFSWTSNGSTYLVDAGGLAYKLASVTDTVIKIEDRANVKVIVGDVLISEEIIQIYQDIISSLTEDGYIIDNLYIKASPLHPGAIISGRNEGAPFTPSKIEVEFSASYPVATQTKLLSQLIETKAGLIKERVDLRTPGYVYYK